MCPKKADLQAVLQVQEQDSHVTVAPALKEEPAKLPEANSTVDARMSEGFHQLEQRIPTLSVPRSRSSRSKKNLGRNCFRLDWRARAANCIDRVRSKVIPV